MPGRESRGRPRETALVPGWMAPGRIDGPAGTWIRGDDLLVVSDVDGDSHSELVIGNNANGWTGVIKWLD